MKDKMQRIRSEHKQATQRWNTERAALQSDLDAAKDQARMLFLSNLDFLWPNAS